MNPYLIIILILLLNIGLVYWISQRYKKKLLDQYHRFLHKTDDILSGKSIKLSYDESLDSAISERLHRIIELSRIQKERAEEERDTVKSLITNISHQIRTPLANITLYSGLLKERLQDPEEFRLSDKIENNAQKLEFFMKELLKSSYAEQEIINVFPTITDLGSLIKKSCQSTEIAAMKKGIQLENQCTSYPVYADPKWTEEVFTNIIENAIKYSFDRSIVQIRSILYDSFVCVQIIDQGIGIDEQEQGKIFQRFYRGTNVTDKQGFGVGLFLAREVLKKQQGYIKVKSVLNQGTTVEVFLLRDHF